MLAMHSARHAAHSPEVSLICAYRNPADQLGISPGRAGDLAAGAIFISNVWMIVPTGMADSGIALPA